MKNKSSFNKGKEKPYTEAQLREALDMIEEGYSHSETLAKMPLNKSILAREMRKRKNSKGTQAAEEYNKFFLEETIMLFDKYVRSDFGGLGCEAKDQEA
jgi:hypothetical protein